MVLTVYTNNWIGDYSNHSTYYTCDINNIEFVDENTCILHIPTEEGKHTRTFTIAAALEERDFCVRTLAFDDYTDKLYVNIPYMGQMNVRVFRR